jgi:uncharacterized protein YbjQ (UPF0145 family)
MLVATTDTLGGKEILTTLGLVRGVSVRAAHAMADFDALLKNAAGGELPEYTAIFAQAREQAMDRMLEQARHLGADAVVGVRFATSEIATGAAEVLAYGTAVKLS